MTDLWRLPTALTVGGKAYAIHADFRDILEIFSYMQDESLPEFIRWSIALRLFYREEIPACHWQEAMDRLADFLCAGRESRQGPKLLDWEQDAPLIVADINRVAGQEIRALPFVHWWTFLAWFHAIGEGQLSTVVSIRDKLHRGKKLEEGEQAFYRANKTLVDIKKTYTPEELAEKERLTALVFSKKRSPKK